jgi:drug/metabolite transporter (DMT)-like permease
MQPENIGPNGQKQPHHLTRSPLFGLGMALLGAVIITPDTLLIRISGLEGWPLSAWRGLLIGGCMFLGWLLMARGSVKSDLKHFAKIPFLIIMVANSGNTMFFNFAAVETSVTVVLTALATVPLLAALLSFLILREPTSKRTWQAIILAMVGVMIVVMNGESAISAPQGSVLLGGFFGVMTALCISVVFVMTRRNPETPVLLAVSTGTLITGCIGFMGTSVDAMLSGQTWAVLLMCLTFMPLAWCLLSLAPRYTSPTNVSLLMLLEMVLGPFWVWLGTGERPSPMMMFGAAIVLVTLVTYIIATARAESRTKPSPGK